MNAEQQELLIRTGPGTACGKLLRSYWQPVALAEDLPPGSPPIPVTILGEDLVLFRDARDRLGMLGRRCPHRGVDLCYARVEEAGLRCIYHGWLLDAAGRCLDQPGVAADVTLRDEIRHKAYPCYEAGGVIFAYLGTGTPPVFPAYEFLDTQPHERFTTKILHKCNFLQALEGNMDQVHLSFLHRVATRREDTYFAKPATGSSKTPGTLLASDVAPTILTQKTDFGMREIVTRSAPEGTYLKVENFALPGFCAVPGGVQGQGGYLVNWHVPVDDVSHWKYVIVFKRGGLDAEALRRNSFGDHPVGRLAHSGELYPQDREEMKRGESFAGFGPGFQLHDLIICEAQGAIVDRTREFLGAEDKSVALLRRVMLDAIAGVERGNDPPHVVRDPARNGFSDLVVLAEIIPAGKAPAKHVAERVAARQVSSAALLAEKT